LLSISEDEAYVYILDKTLAPNRLHRYNINTDGLSDRINNSQTAGTIELFHDLEYIKDFGVYLKSGVELVSAIIVALVIGIFLDNYFQSKPIFLIIFLILGFAAGIMNVYRSVKKLGFEVGFKKKNDKLH